MDQTSIVVMDAHTTKTSCVIYYLNKEGTK